MYKKMFDLVAESGAQKAITAYLVFDIKLFT